MDVYAKQLTRQLPSEPPAGGGRNIFPVAPKDSPTSPALHTDFDLEKNRSARCTFDQRLLTSEGIVQVARRLKVRLPAEFLLNSETLVQFSQAVMRSFEPEQGIIAEALVYLANGQVRIDNDETPDFGLGIFEEPIFAYLASLEFLDDHLEAEQSGTALGPERAFAYRQHRWSETWQRRVDFAAGFEDRIIRMFRTGDGQRVVLGEDAPVTVLVADPNKPKRDYHPFTSFWLNTTTVGEEPSILERPVAKPIPTSADRKLGAFLRVDDYPDEAVRNRTSLEHIVTILPLAPDTNSASFRLSINGLREGVRYTIEIITGQGCHTDLHRLISQTGGCAQFGLPSRFGGLFGKMPEQFFKSTALTNLNALDRDRAKESGSEGAQSIVIILKPQVESTEASRRKSIIQIHQKTLKPEDFARRIYNSSERRVTRQALPTYIEAGYLNDEQAKAIRREFDQADAHELEQREYLQQHSWGSDGGLMRGGGSSMLKLSGDGTYNFEKLFTGEGAATGDKFGTYDGPLLAPDPFSPPRILVIHPIGVSETHAPEIPSSVDEFLTLHP
jgi:hypothetical protein